MCNPQGCAHINIDPLFMHNGITPEGGEPTRMGLAYSKNMRSEYFFAKKKGYGGKTMII